ncbi:LEA type 2 family protein [Hymenobacter sp. GOD-10R]|uniref:LEA type 2 family protein n=1 Tax=Hymenobacter sp. GOD-10R TaxID=3093922 RepID=UPI002D770C92|nr:LEA type 2 family protein [Hymenobacter sp. GOD-10R]WRQ30180.1 LEA type 2 family protein [Hymenobacter sp. GOD-10R]
MLRYFYREQHRISLATVSVFLLLGLSCCGIGEQVQQAKAFKDADIRLASIEQATVAGVNVLGIRKASDLSILDQARLATSYASGNLPLRMRVNLEVRNPNDETAALNELDYIALIDGKQVATGHTTERIEVAPNGGLATVPVTLESNLHEALGKESGASLTDLVLGLANQDQQPMRLTLRLRPTFITSNGRRISPTGYINVNKDFTAREALDAVQHRDSLNQRP